MADFEQHRADFDVLRASIVALSSDPIDDARGVIQRLSLTFPVGYGLDPDATSRAIGCYTGVHDGTPHIQPASFVLDQNRNVAYAVYSSGKVGRFTGNDALTVVRGLRERDDGA